MMERAEWASLSWSEGCNFTGCGLSRFVWHMGSWEVSPSASMWGGKDVPFILALVGINFPMHLRLLLKKTSVSVSVCVSKVTQYTKANAIFISIHWVNEAREREWSNTDTYALCLCLNRSVRWNKMSRNKSKNKTHLITRQLNSPCLILPCN